MYTCSFLSGGLVCHEGYVWAHITSPLGYLRLFLVVDVLSCDLVGFAVCVRYPLPTVASLTAMVSAVTLRRTKSQGYHHCDKAAASRLVQGQSSLFFAPFFVFFGRG